MTEEINHIALDLVVRTPVGSEFSVAVIQVPCQVTSTPAGTRIGLRSFEVPEDLADQIRDGLTRLMTMEEE